MLISLDWFFFNVVLLLLLEISENIENVKSDFRIP